MDTHYACRSGGSGNDMADGIFVIRCDYTISWIHWGYGAALSFKLIASYYYIRHGGFSNGGTPCGAFCVHALYAFSDSGWSVGTALSFKPYIIYFSYIL